MNSADLQRKFIPFLFRKKFQFVAENKYLFEKESDIISLKDGELHEFEFKINSSDFEKDIRKCRHIKSRPNYFYYVVLDESVIKGHFLDYAGIYVHKFHKDGHSSFKKIREATKIRNDSASWDELYSLLIKVRNGQKTN